MRNYGIKRGSALPEVSGVVIGQVRWQPSRLQNLRSYHLLIPENKDGVISIAN